MYIGCWFERHETLKAIERYEEDMRTHRLASIAGSGDRVLTQFLSPPEDNPRISRGTEIKGWFGEMKPGVGDLHWTATISSDPTQYDPGDHIAVTVTRHFDKETKTCDTFTPSITGEISDPPLADLSDVLLENPGNKAWLEVVNEDKAYTKKMRSFSSLDLAHKDYRFTESNKSWKPVLQVPSLGLPQERYIRAGPRPEI